jgi:hypothetical protein
MIFKATCEWEYLGPAGNCELERLVLAKKAKWYLHNLLEGKTYDHNIYCM